MRSFYEDIVPVIFFVGYLTRVNCNELFLNSLIISTKSIILVPTTNSLISIWS